ncbi:MAG: hypothetical protein KDD44_08760, partial [Bdellovibrionales bacterium]|nr:hypothetical protein [Bdellovibrionales bacterium]
DEFKIGEAIFRVNYDEPVVRHDAPANGSGRPASAPTRQQQQAAKRRRLLLFALVAAVLVLALAFSGGSSRRKAPLDSVVMELPQNRVIGYLADGRRKTERDSRHKRAARFALPPADVLIQYDFRGEAPVTVALDQAEITRLSPDPDIWNGWQIVVRDTLAGGVRELIFTNTTARQDAKPKKWGIRDVRAVPVSRNATRTLDSQLEEARALAELLDKTPPSLIELIRALQTAMLEHLYETAQDGFAYSIDLESQMPTPAEIAQNIDGIIAERRNAAGSVLGEVSNRHLRVLGAITGKLEGELTRRVNNRFNLARLASSAKNYIDAHDHLLAIMKMFPDEIDPRWSQANEMLNDSKIIPKKVRENPAKYRARR